MKKIYLAAGCLWGVEEYFSYVNGVIATRVGLANGFINNQLVENPLGYAECCEITYDSNIVSLEKLLDYMFKIINPKVPAEDTKYRSGIYYVDLDTKEIALDFIKNQQKNYQKQMAVEVEPLTSFFLSAEKHQQYLKKNPTGYCHIPKNLIAEIKSSF